MKKIRPFLKWAGNKYRCLHHILNSLPPANRLIEPFAGSAATFLNTNYSQYLLGEINADLITLFHHIQSEGIVFINYCEELFRPANNCASNYYLLRDQFNHCTQPRQRAALFLYLNRHGYNGLCRYNQQGRYNVPFGRYEKPYFPRAELLYFHHKSQQAEFIHSDFCATFAKAEPGDVIYCDPPYSPRNQTSNFSSYIHQKFGDEAHIKLAQLAENSTKRGITVIISNHDTEFTRYQYRHSEIKTFNVKRSISCHAKKRIEVQELIAIFRG